MDYVACSLWRVGSPALPGSVKQTCVHCRCDVELSVQGVEWIAQSPHTRRISCVPCAVASKEPLAGAVPGAVKAVDAEIERRRGR